jgi:Large polyvalent protein-associated domain 1
VLGRRRSTYSEQAQRLCGKSGEYWVRPTEMFARAFESYVFDRLKEKGANSPYLVHGVEEKRYSDRVLFKGNPYPVGAERAAIGRRIEAVAASMKARVELELGARALSPAR